MTYYIYTIFDRISGQYSAPFLEFNDTSACRYFSTKNFGQLSPTDFELYKIGTFDTTQGSIDFVAKEYIMRGSSDVQA